MQLLCCSESMKYCCMITDIECQTLIIRKLQNTPPTGYKSSTMEKGSICVYMIHLPLAYVIFPLLEQDKRRNYIQMRFTFICICHKAPSCFMFPVCQICTLFSLSLEVPQRTQLTTATAKIFKDKTAWSFLI